MDSDGDGDEALPPEIRVSEFDYSAENYFKVVDKIAMLSGESELEYEQTEIQRLSSSVTFLRCAAKSFSCMNVSLLAI